MLLSLLPRRVSVIPAVALLSMVLACGSDPDAPDTDEPPETGGISLVSQGAAADRTGFTLVVRGTGFTSESVVRWNDSPRPTRLLAPTELSAEIPASDVAAPAAVKITVATPGSRVLGPATFTVRTLAEPALTDVKTLSLPANDIVYDARSRRLYVSLPSSAGSLGNTVAAIDPVTGATTGSVFVGSEPGILALSDDSQWLYVGLESTGLIRRVRLPGLLPDLEIALPIGIARDIEVMPGNPRTVAIATNQWTGMPPEGVGVYMYDDAVQRPTTVSAFNNNDSIVFGSDSVLFGFDNFTSEHGLRTIVVDETGVREKKMTPGLGGFYDRIEYAAGRIYAARGGIMDAERLLVIVRIPVGTIFIAGAVFPDAELGRVYYISDSGRLVSYDMNNFQLLGTVTVPGFSNAEHPAIGRGRVVKWGEDGIAVRDGQRVFIVRTTLVKQ